MKSKLVSSTIILFYICLYYEPGDISNTSGGSRGVSLVSTETPFQIGINKIIYNHALINYSC